MTKSGMFGLSNDKDSKKKFLAPILFVLILIISFVGSVSAITGSLGNARMVISKDENGEPIVKGDIIEKYILVKNVNEEEIKIGLRATGDLAEYIELEETEFVLAPGTDKKAYFTIKVPSNGTTESRIEVTFSSENKKNGVGLTSTIIVVAKQGENNNLFETFGSKEIILISTGIIIIVLFLLLISYSIRKNKLKKSAEQK